jgi:AcrR family transcriptional regulator
MLRSISCSNVAAVPPPTPSLRDRKRARTRQAIVDAAVELIERDGYDATTVADIAAAAEIGTRTFFSYFASKEEVLFPEMDGRVRTALAAIAARRPGEGPVDVLLRGLDEASAGSDMTGRLGALRLRLVRTVPAVRGRGLQLQQDGMRDIARHLGAAYPDELDEVRAAALVGAFIGAVTGALDVLLADGPVGSAEELRTRMRQATATALAPWRHPSGT